MASPIFINSSKHLLLLTTQSSHHTTMSSFIDSLEKNNTKKLFVNKISLFSNFIINLPIDWII